MLRKCCNAPADVLQDEVFGRSGVIKTAEGFERLLDPPVLAAGSHKA